MSERAADYYYSTAEVAERLRALKDGDVKRLEQMAGVWSRGVRHYGSNDFLGTMFLRMLEGTRQWPRGMLLEVVLDQDFRSLQSQYLDHEELERKNNATQILASEAFSEGDAAEALASLRRDDETPLDLLCRDELIPEMESLFADNETAQLMIMAWAEGQKKADIMADIGISEMEYDSTSKLILRRKPQLTKQ